MNKKILVAGFIFLLFQQSLTYAEVKINEIYPAPETGQLEWVELYNNSENTYDLTQYSLFDFANNPLKIPQTTIGPFEYTVATSSSVLNNSGDTLYLKKMSETIEIATYSGSLTNTTSLNRCPNGIGQFYTLQTLTMGSSNEPACLSLSPTVSPTFTPTPILSPTTQLTTTPTTTPTPVPIIILSEIYPYPKDDEYEWVELYNATDTEVILNNWYIDDIENGGSSPDAFSTLIPSKQFIVIEYQKSFLNNSGDTVRLLDPTLQEVSSVSYGQSYEGDSFGISDESHILCKQVSSKNSANFPCLNITPTPTTIKLSKTPTPSKQPKATPAPPQHIANQVLGLNTSTIKSITITGQQKYKSTQNTDEQTHKSSEIIIEQTANKKSSQQVVSFLSFSTFTSSLLTICSILLKIKSI